MENDDNTVTIELRSIDAIFVHYALKHYAKSESNFDDRDRAEIIEVANKFKCI